MTTIESAHTALQNTLLDLARNIEYERKWLDKAAKLWAGQLGKPKDDQLSPENKSDLDNMIRDAGQLRDQRANEIRAVANEAPRKVAAILFHAATKLDNGGAEVPRMLAEAAATLALGATVQVETIPPGHRSRAMSKQKAARYLRGGNSDSAVEWLNKCIEDGTISCETLSRQSHVFDVRQFPATARARIDPK